MMQKDSFSRKTIIVIVLLAVTLLIGFAADVFLLIFASIVLAVLLSGLCRRLQQLLHLKYSIALLITCILLLIVLSGTVWLLYPSLSSQANELQTTLPKALQQLKDQLSASSWGKYLVNGLSDAGEAISKRKADIISRTTGVFSSTLGALANFFIVIISALFLAAEPTVYVKGLLQLLPAPAEKKLKEVLQQSYQTLSAWLKGKFLSMLVVGILTYAGLLLLGFPIAFVLALIAMVLTFIPNIGPVLALIPAVLIGLMEGPKEAVHVIILYLLVQLLESYFITPFINKKAVSLPPALTLFWQILLGTFAGATGLFLATPMLAVIIVFIREYYIKDHLQKSAAG